MKQFFMRQLFHDRKSTLKILHQLVNNDSNLESTLLYSQLEISILMKYYLL